MQSLRQRWSNDEIRATDERKGGSDSRDRESKQAQSWSSDNRAGFVTCLQQTHRKSSFPVGLHMHKVVQPGHVGSADRPTGQLEFCWMTVCWGVVLFLKPCVDFVTLPGWHHGSVSAV